MRRLNEQETQTQLQVYNLDQPRGPGFAFCDPARNTAYDWHTHDYHQLIYAVAGTLQVETEGTRHVLAVGAAVWIPAATRHRTFIADVDGASLYFAPDAVCDHSGRVRILAANAVMREMILHALHWPLGVSEVDPLAGSFFRTLGLMCSNWLESELPGSLPSSRHPAIKRVMDYVTASPGNADLPGALAVAAMSERSFRRNFGREAGMTWQGWLRQARILEAAGRLRDGDRITEVAAEVGYASLSAFAQAFRQVMGETPADFKRRLR